MPGHNTDSALLDCAKRQRKLYRTAQFRNALTKLIYPQPIERLEHLFTWAIATGPVATPEQAFIDELKQELLFSNKFLATDISDALILSRRAQAHALSLSVAAAYPTIAKIPITWRDHFVTWHPLINDHLESIQANGGLVLTAHSFFHNLLGAILGIRGNKVFGVAAPLGIGEDWPIIGGITKAINEGSERLFGGGRYLYINQPRELLHGIHQAKQENDVVVGLLDHGDHSSDYKFNLMGHRIGFQDSLINRFCADKQPIFFGMLWPILSRDGSRLLPRWQLHIESLKPVSKKLDAAGILAAYTRSLNSWIATNPWAWQGFRWLQFFPAWQKENEQEPALLVNPR